VHAFGKIDPTELAKLQCRGKPISQVIDEIADTTGLAETALILRADIPIPNTQLDSKVCSVLDLLVMDGEEVLAVVGFSVRYTNCQEWD
jgi:hypothetical protein